ncbi:hypothetical protein [Corynebacterium sp.]|uniref:hypothetical protein n=1 Tax=Corynebacterium sp. TaxID=1720 RepID=UPI0026E06BCF|nr:hypothetical protein [Corynebacterium sp.]MDO5511981.1 hypothetical protein [Corynebacterium sp.]
MSNPFNQNDQNPASGPEQPNYDAYQYPSSGDNTSQQGGAGYGGYDNPAYTQGAYSDAGYGGAPGGAGWALNEEKNRVAPWALGVGIVALIAAISMFFTAFAVLIGLIGLIISIVALVRSRRIQGPGRRTGMSVAGLVLSIIAIVISILFWVFVGGLITQSGMLECFELTDTNQQQACVEESLDSWMNS